MGNTDPRSQIAEMNLEDFLEDARCWLDGQRPRRDEHSPRSAENAAPAQPCEPVADNFNVSVFHTLSFDEERTLLQTLQRWTMTKAERGYHAIDWPVELGGLGLGRDYARGYSRLESQYQVPVSHETHSVTTGLIAPTIRVFGTDEQQLHFVDRFRSARELCCQLFSEPGAGSDLATLACRAERDGEEWVINGQKVWSSGAQFSQWGELIARTDPTLPKHAGLSAFIIPMDLPGVEVRPIRQMTGGSSFNEVFLTDVRVPDSLRLGAIGDGWKVALTTLGFERDHSSGGGGGLRVGGTWRHVLATARASGRLDDPLIRQDLMRVYTHHRVEGFVNRRAADMRRAGSPPGPEGSLGKLLWTEGMTLISDVVARLVGPGLIADDGRPGTYAWNEHVLGAPGYRIAGGSDEIQRNILGERVLGLPAEPRVDKDLAWRDIAR